VTEYFHPYLQCYENRQSQAQECATKPAVAAPQGDINQYRHAPACYLRTTMPEAKIATDISSSERKALSKNMAPTNQCLV
jgi:hypothetical protein